MSDYLVDSKDNTTTRIEQLHTSCHDCIFKTEYKHDKQVGCQLLRLDLYKQKGLTVIEAQNDTQEFYIINGIKCHSKRTTSWGDKVQTNRGERVRQENRMKYQAIIFTVDEPENGFDNLKLTIRSLLDQSIPPQHITVVREKTSSLQPSIISRYLDSTGIPWRIENIIDKDVTDFDTLDTIIRTCKYPYYLTTYAWMSLPSNFIETINEKIYDDNLRFAILCDGDENLPVLVSTAIHWAYGGHRPTSLMEKLQYDKCDSLIIDINQIYQNYPK